MRSLPDFSIPPSKLMVLRAVLFAYRHFPNPVRHGLQLLNRCGLSFAFTRLLLGHCHFVRGENQKALQYWRNAFKHPNSFIPVDPDVLIEWLGDYAHLVARVERDQDEIFRVLKALLPGHLSFLDTDPQEVLSALRECCATDQEFETKIRHLEHLLRPKLDVLEKVPIEQVAGENVQLAGRQDFRFTDPAVFSSDQPPVNRQIQVPELRLWQLRGAQIRDAFQLVQNNSYLIYEPAADPTQTKVAGSWLHFSKIPGQPNKVISLRREKPLKTLPAGILISGRVTQNYFHWLVEYLPRTLLCQNVPAGVPFLVAENLPSQIMDSLSALQENRPVLPLNLEDHVYSVEQLWVPSFHTNLSDNYEVPFYLGGGFSKELMLQMKTRIEKWAGVDVAQKPFRRIYLDRGGTRSILNRKRIIRFLKSRDFEIVRTENLSFREQVLLFSQAQIVMGSTGAAMANILFMQPGSHVIAFITPRNVQYALKANLAKLVGAEFIYIAGKHLWPRYFFKSEAEFAHSNFSISLRQLRKVLKGHS